MTGVEERKKEKDRPAAAAVAISSCICKLQVFSDESEDETELISDCYRPWRASVEITQAPLAAGGCYPALAWNYMSRF